MGGIMKGAHGHGYMHAAAHGGGGGGSSSSRGRWSVYVVMGITVLLVFGCGIVGLMGLHSLKDRRLLTLFINEKDDQILSLHLLLQKEREQVQEVTRKCEEMKMKIHSLRSQKAELNGRLLEMQSTISSLREEQRTIELAYQEKQNEAKFLRERYIDAKDQNPQVILQPKAARIEDLNHRVGLPADVGSVSADEASIASGNGTTNNQNRDKREDVHVTEHDEGIREMESSMESEEKRGNSEERSAEIRRTDVDKSEQSSETAKTKNLGDDQEEESEVDLTENKELATVGDADSRRTSTSDISNLNKELGAREGGVKLELHENSRGQQFTLRGKHSELRRAKGKRRYGSSSAAIKDIGNRFEKGQPRNGDKVHNESVLKTNVKDYTEENIGGNGEESPSGIKLQDRIKPVGAEDMISGKFAKFDMSNRVEDEREVMTEHPENKNNAEQDSSPGGREDLETNDDRHDNRNDHDETEMRMESAQHSGENGEADKEETDESDF